MANPCEPFLGPNGLEWDEPEAVRRDLHDDEIPIDTGLVRALAARAMPDYADLPVRRLESSGSTNALFRLGDNLLIRLPRQPGGSAAVEKEARWLPVLAPSLPVQVPEVVAVFDPDCGYPERWPVIRWIDGEHPEVITPQTPANPRRQDLAADLASIVLDVAERLWDQAMRLPGTTDRPAPRWYHGDLAAENLLMRDGRLTAVLDFGGLAIGDPAVDLAVAWEVLDPPVRETFRSKLGVDDATWLRGRAWALCITLMIWYYWTTMPQRRSSRIAIGRNILADAGYAT